MLEFIIPYNPTEHITPKLGLIRKCLSDTTYHFTIYLGTQVGTIGTVELPSTQITGQWAPKRKKTTFFQNWQELTTDLGWSGHRMHLPHRRDIHG